MKWSFVVIFLLLFLSFAFNITNATTWYVHPDSTLNSIQTALDSCSNYDTVLVAPGTYFENIFWPNIIGIKLFSQVGTDSTIIDGGASGRVIMVASSVVTTTIIDGFTIQNGHDDCGSGIFCIHSSPIISNNIITTNIADTAGGGIMTSLNASPLIMNNTICNNASKLGAGFYCGSGNATIINNTITDNIVNLSGGGISCHSFTGIIRNNIITQNTAPFGGGIWCYDCSSTIDSCTISNNNGQGVYCRRYNSDLIINYNNIYANTGYGVYNEDSTVIINAEYNWWGDATGPFHPDSNPGGQGDTVSNYVDFIPWLTGPVGVEKEEKDRRHKTTNLRLLCYPIPFTTGISIYCSGISEKQKVALGIYDVSGRLVKSVPITTRHLSLGTDLKPGIYFLKVDGKYIGKVVKVR